VQIIMTINALTAGCRKLERFVARPAINGFMLTCQFETGAVVIEIQTLLVYFPACCGMTQ